MALKTTDNVNMLVSFSLIEHNDAHSARIGDQAVHKRLACGVSLFFSKICLHLPLSPISISSKIVCYFVPHETQNNTMGSIYEFCHSVSDISLLYHYCQSERYFKIVSGSTRRDLCRSTEYIPYSEVKTIWVSRLSLVKEDFIRFMQCSTPLFITRVPVLPGLRSILLSKTYHL